MSRDVSTIMLWRDLKAWQVYGANTDVGKTIVSTVLCKALQRRAPSNGVLYLKPVSTGPLNEADDRHISRFAPGVVSKCLSQFSEPVSPHLAAKIDSVDKVSTPRLGINFPLADLRRLSQTTAPLCPRSSVSSTSS